MSDTFDHNSLPEDELLAAEYALGVLEGANRATAEQRMARERGFARRVSEWEQRLAPRPLKFPSSSRLRTSGTALSAPCPCRPKARAFGRASRSGAGLVSRPAPSCGLHRSTDLFRRVHATRAARRNDRRRRPAAFHGDRRPETWHRRYRPRSLQRRCHARPRALADPA